MFFSQLATLLQNCKELKCAISLAPNGSLRVVVTPSRASNAPAALSHPLALSGSAEELDAGFAEAIAAYTGARQSLVEQIDATTTVLKNAEKKQVAKVNKAITSKSSQPATAAAGGDSESNDRDTDDDDDDDESSDSQSTRQAESTSASAGNGQGTTSTTGTDLSSLI